MKRIKKICNIIFSFLLGALSFSVILVSAEIIVASSEVTISSEKTSQKYLGGAIDELYTLCNNNCADGYSYDIGEGKCYVYLNSGEYKTNKGLPTLCLPGYYSTYEGKGYYDVAYKCKICEEGYYCEGGNHHEQCPSGTTSNSGASKCTAASTDPYTYGVQGYNGWYATYSCDPTKTKNNGTMTSCYHSGKCTNAGNLNDLTGCQAGRTSQVDLYTACNYNKTGIVGGGGLSATITCPAQ